MSLVRWIWLACALALFGTGTALATHRPADVRPEQLQPGEFVWLPEAAPSGPLLLVVSLVEQRAYLYRNGVRIAVTTVSTGKPGNETPPGVFTILQKHKEHYSNLYDNAPMPFMQRLSWSGVALHAGRLPGYPASHGCIRLPNEFARRLFDVTTVGMAPTVSGEGEPTAPLPANFWAPDRAPEGPLTILVSTSEQSVRVLRNGVEIGRARFHLDGAPPTGVQVLQLQAGTLPGESAYVPGKPRLNWRQVTLDDAGGMDAQPSARNELYGRLHVDPEFARQVYDALRPGTTVIVTDGATQTTTGDEPILDSAPTSQGGAGTR
jgi:hypothetical protein